MKKNTQLIGALILVVTMMAIAGFLFFQQGQPKQVELRGLVGGEKIPWLENTEVQKIAKKKYGVTYDIRKEGSIEMVQPGVYQDYDYLFPSSQFPADLFKANGGQAKVDEIILNTPIVLFSRKPVVEALTKAGYVSQKDGVHYVDMKKLALAIKEGKSWQSIGLGQLYGDILVDTTDPNASNSGNMFLGLLANSLNDNKPVTAENLEAIKDDVKQIYGKLGYSQTSSADLFNQFLQQGMGAFPLIAAYESQLLEFSISKPDVYNQIKDDIVILYPTPTVWSSHVFIGLNDDSRQFQKALLDPEVQKIAWEQHGFRTVVAGTNDIKHFKVNGVAKEVTQIMPLPNPKVMQELMKLIQ
ncbi:substrate-binding domain-containing protein [Vaginisenegalia massiliensis]|uniref:substrate-binding domain-containing protein n=1 Tax=Vaginisenegalia massiliensis TaxID=2058294 RepID=UPI000F54A75C|nr:substrate-binding domain-containing protein [Vaginisenegalia massiliensis]